MDTIIPNDNNNKRSLQVTIFPFFLTPKFFLEEIYEQPSNQFYSKFVSLKNVRSDYLVELVELVRSKHGRMFIITSEIPYKSLSEQLEAYALSESGDNINNIINLLALIANALTDLKRFNLVHGLLTPSQIFPSNENLLLAGYWWNKLSEFGLLTEFPICNLEYSSPELVAYYLNKKLTGLNAESLTELNLPFTYKTDIWSLGSILFSLLTQKSLYNQPEFNASLFKLGLKLFLGDGKTVIGFNNWLDTNLEETRARFVDSEVIEQVDGLIELTKACLRIDPSERITLEELRSSPLLSNYIQQSSTKQNWQSYPILPSENSKLLETTLTPQQLLHIWKLSGGDINQLVDNKLPPILSLPTIVQNSEDLQSQKNLDPTLLFDMDSRIRLDLGRLIKDKVLESGVELCNNEVLEGDSVDNIIGQNIYKESSIGYYNLSQILNQKDFHLNLNRIELFNKLLSQYPSSLEEIKLHSKSLGIPNQLRGPIWSCLLQVEYKDLQKYDKINKNLSLGIDKQLQLDITRCQQYNPLLASNLGHSKLFNVLKSWQLSNPDKVYWQGIDSLAGIFLSCNFNNEARALICLENFINKYQLGFFTDNNSSTLWSYLGIFLQLLNFHDPVLTSHLHKLGLGPKAYAINWFYTMFAYVFPLDKLVLLWDRILVSEANYPWLVGLAILNQLRFDILKSEQLGTIPLSTDSFLDIDLELCLSTADNLYHLTPNTLFDIELFKIMNPPPQNSWEFPEELVNLPILNISEWQTIQDRGFIMDLRSKSQFKGRHLKNSFHLDKPVHLLKVVANTLRPYSETQIMGLLCDDKQIGEGFVQGLIRNQFGHLIRITDWDEYYSELIDVSDGNDQNKVNIEWCTCSGKEAFRTQPKYKDNPNVLLRKCVYLKDL